jgi:uncharacterized membrane protein
VLISLPSCDVVAAYGRYGLACPGFRPMKREVIAATSIDADPRPVTAWSAAMVSIIEIAAPNQGLYNGFLAAGLAYGLIADSRAFQIFFLCCVIVAGVYGTVTATRRILFMQVIPGAIALLLVLST